jgi:hypothetical protein
VAATVIWHGEHTVTPRVFVIVGGPGSGKDDLIQAVRDLGTRHAAIVPKHTSRRRRHGDEDEMICSDDANFALDACDVRYDNYGDAYGISSQAIWDGLSAGISQALVVSSITGINALRERFGELLVLVYVHSELTQDQYVAIQLPEGDAHDLYSARRAAAYRDAFRLYVENILAFDHVLLASTMKEDLYDQLFRLFRAYETGRVNIT